MNIKHTLPCKMFFIVFYIINLKPLFKETSLNPEKKYLNTPWYQKPDAREKAKDEIKNMRFAYPHVIQNLLYSSIFFGFGYGNKKLIDKASKTMYKIPMIQKMLPKNKIAKLAYIPYTLAVSYGYSPFVINMIQKSLMLKDLTQNPHSFSQNIVFASEYFKEDSPPLENNVFLRGAYRMDIPTGIERNFYLSYIKDSFKDIFNYLFPKASDTLKKHNLINEKIHPINQFNVDQIKNIEEFEIVKKAYEDLSFTEYNWGGFLQEEERIEAAAKFSVYLKDKYINNNADLNLTGHSYGGITAIDALYKLFKEGALKNYTKKIHLFTIASPITEDETNKIKEMMLTMKNINYCGTFFKKDYIPNSDAFRTKMISTEKWIIKLEKEINQNPETTGRVKIFSVFQKNIHDQKRNVSLTVPIEHTEGEKILYNLLKMNLDDPNLPNVANLII